MAFSNLLRILLPVSAGALLVAEEGALRGPTSGFVYDEPTRSIRVVNGVPGAAYLGPAAAAELDAGFVSPDGRAALALSGGRLLLVELGGEPAVTDLAPWSAPSAKAAWNRAGSAAAIAGDRLLLISRAAGQTEVADLGPGEGIAALAVDYAGAGVIAARRGQIQYCEREAGCRDVFPLAEPAALAASPVAHEIFAADASRGEILRIRNYQESAEPSLFAGGNSMIESVAGLALSPDGSTLYVAGRALSVFRTAGAELIHTEELDFEPACIEPLSDRLYLLTLRKAPQEPLQVLQTGERFGVYFVPGAGLSPVSSPVVED